MQAHEAARVITAIAHEVLESSDSDHFSDWKEDIKMLCAKRKIPYDSRVVGEALESALYQRKRVVDQRWPPK